MSNRELWRVVSLGEVATLVKGISYASEDYCGPDEGATFITIKCVSKAGGFKPEGIKYFKGEIPDRQRLKPGDLLIANTDLTRAGDIVGCPITVPELGGGHITLSMDLSKLIEKPDQIERRFLYYRLMSEDVRSFMKDHASGSTVLHLQTRAVPHLSFDLPPKKEQSKIAEVLATVDQAIEQTEALIAKQQRIKTGLMQDLLTRGIDEHGQLRTEQTHAFKDSPLGRIPVEWGVQTLESVSEFVTSGSRGWAQYYSTEGALFLRIGNLTRKHINMRFDDVIRVSPPASSEGERTAVKKDDLLISITADLGIVAVIPDGFETAYVNQHIALTRLDRTQAHARFVGWFFNGQLGQAQFDKLNESGAKAGLNLPSIKNLQIPVPSLDEQAKIAQAIDATTQKTDEFHARLVKCQSLKRALMQDLLTGRKRVVDLLHAEVAA